MTITPDKRRILLGDKIQSLRVEQGLSQRKFAMMIDTYQAHIWQIETGKISPTVDLLCRIADGLDVQVKDLIDF